MSHRQRIIDGMTCFWCRRRCRDGAVSDIGTRRTFCSDLHRERYRRHLTGQRRNVGPWMQRLGYSRERAV